MKIIARYLLGITLLILPLFMFLSKGFSFGAETAGVQLAENKPLVAQASPAPEAAPGLSLNDCYALALKQSETIARDAELIKEAEAHFLQSLGTALPQVSFVASDNWQNPTPSSSSSAGQHHEISRYFVFKQTLFSGFKEFAAMSGGKLERRQRELEKRRAEELLFVDVVDAFYLFLEEQADLKALEDIHQALSERVDELKRREDIGRSRHSEVVNTEARLYNIEAQIEQAKSQQLIAAELLSFLTGTTIERIKDAPQTAGDLNEEVNYTARADMRSDVKAAEYALGVANKKVTVAKSDLFPTVTAEGDAFIHRADAPGDQSWESVLKVDVPIFEGTTTYGNIKAANAQAKSNELQLQLTRRLAGQDIHDSYVRAQSSILQYQALDKALKSAELNYDLQKEDYQYNLVSNLDVLTAIENLGDTRRNYIQTLYAKKRYYWELQAAAGETITDKKP